MRPALLIACVMAVLTACSRTPVYPKAPESGAVVAIPLAGLREDSPAFYTFVADGGKKVNFFVLRKGGEVKSYLDACARCYPQKLGYRSEDGRVVCKACEVGYGNHSLKDGIGSCYPISLAGGDEGSVYIINREDLLKAARYF